MMWRRWFPIYFSDNSIVQFHSVYGRGMLNSFSWRKSRIVRYYVLIYYICFDCFYSCRDIVMWSLEGGRGKLPPPWCSILFTIYMMKFSKLFYNIWYVYYEALSIFNDVTKNLTLLQLLFHWCLSFTIFQYILEVCFLLVSFW